MFVNKQWLAVDEPKDRNFQRGPAMRMCPCIVHETSFLSIQETPGVPKYDEKPKISLNLHVRKTTTMKRNSVQE